MTAGLEPRSSWHGRGRGSLSRCGVTDQSHEAATAA